MNHMNDPKNCPACYEEQLRQQKKDRTCTTIAIIIAIIMAFIITNKIMIYWKS